MARVNVADAHPAFVSLAVAGGVRIAGRGVLGDNRGKAKVARAGAAEAAEERRLLPLACRARDPSQPCGWSPLAASLWVSSDLTRRRKTVWHLR